MYEDKAVAAVVQIHCFLP